MQDKKVTNLTSLIERKPEGHFGWISPTAFMPPAGTPAADSHAVKTARLLGDTLIDMLNTNEFRGNQIKIKVAAPKAPKQVAADEMTSTQTRELANIHVLEEILANGDKLHKILELLDHRPTINSFAASLTRLNQNVDGHTDRKIEELSQKIENWTLIVRADVLSAISEYVAGEQPEATPLPVNTTTKIITDVGGRQREVPVPAPDRPLNFQGMPKDVNDRINRNLQRQATIKRTLGFPVEGPVGAATDPAAVEKVLTMDVGLSQINLNSLREDHDQLVRYLKRDIQKIAESISDGAALALARGMLDNAGRFAATLSRWKEAVDHLGKHAAELSSESGALRKELGL